MRSGGFSPADLHPVSFVREERPAQVWSKPSDTELGLFSCRHVASNLSSSVCLLSVSPGTMCLCPCPVDGIIREFGVPCVWVIVKSWLGLRQCVWPPPVLFSSDYHWCSQQIVCVLWNLLISQMCLRQLTITTVNVHQHAQLALLLNNHRIASSSAQGRYWFWNYTKVGSRPSYHNSAPP